MHTRLSIAILAILLPVGFAFGANPEARSKSHPDAWWPQFRGPDARGVVDDQPLPTEWDVESGKNIRWKTKIPGLGHSSPIIAGDRVFITTSISGKKDASLRVGLYGDIVPVSDDTEHVWRVYALNRENGSILWQHDAHKDVPEIQRHPKATHANCTPATDGKHVVAFFGSEGLYCYDVEGNLLWEKDLGVLDAGFFRVPAAQWEYGSSPVIHDGKVYVQCDVQNNPFLAAFDIKDGSEVWRTKREEVCTWSTPTIYDGGERTQLLVNGFKHIGGYDAKTGEEIWKMSGGADIPVPTPFVAHGLVFITSAHGMPPPLFAVRVGAEGDITLKEDQRSNRYVAWSHPRRGTYMQTPIVYGDLLYTCQDNGVLSCYEAKTGEEKFRARIGDGATGFTASAVAGDGKLYYTSEEGDVYVYKAGPEEKQLAVSDLGEICMATPAIADGNLFFRSADHLFCIGSESKKETAEP